MEFFSYALDHNRNYEWIGYWRGVKDCFQADYYYRIALDAKINVEGERHRVAYFSDAIGNFLLDMGLYNSAQPFFEQSLKIAESFFKLNHPDIATSLSNLVALYNKQGRYDEAVPLIQRALKIYENNSGPNHPDTKTTYQNLEFCKRKLY